jgi:hypothetical protein
VEIKYEGNCSILLNLIGISCGDVPNTRSSHVFWTRCSASNVPFLGLDTCINDDFSSTCCRPNVTTQAGVLQHKCNLQERPKVGIPDLTSTVFSLYTRPSILRRAETWLIVETVGTLLGVVNPARVTAAGLVTYSFRCCWESLGPTEIFFILIYLLSLSTDMMSRY